jgi:hypothetical protein
MLSEKYESEKTDQEWFTRAIEQEYLANKVQLSKLDWIGRKVGSRPAFAYTHNI